MAEQPTTVREVGGATLAVLTYTPWPIVYVQAPVDGYALDSVPVRRSTYVVRLAWGFLPNAFLAQLRSLPTTRATEWWLRRPGGGGAEAEYGWVRGVLTRPEGELPLFTPADWDSQVWELRGASLI